jgi:hypothetical protein
MPPFLLSRPGASLTVDAGEFAARFRRRRIRASIFRETYSKHFPAKFYPACCLISMQRSKAVELIHNKIGP